MRCNVVSAAGDSAVLARRLPNCLTVSEVNILSSGLSWPQPVFTVRKWCEEMSKTFCYADEAFMVLLSIVYNVRVVVYSINSSRLLISTFDCNDEYRSTIELACDTDTHWRAIVDDKQMLYNNPDGEQIRNASREWPGAIALIHQGKCPAQ